MIMLGEEIGVPKDVVVSIVPASVFPTFHPDGTRGAVGASQFSEWIIDIAS